MSPILTRPVRKPLMRLPQDDGDYATLRDLPLVTLPEEPAETQQHCGSSSHDHHETSSSSDSSGFVDSGFSSGGSHSAVASVTVPLAHPHPSPRLAMSRDLCNPYGYVKPRLTTFAAPHPAYHSNTVAGLHPNHNRNYQQQHSPFHSLPMNNRYTIRLLFGVVCLFIYPSIYLSIYFYLFIKIRFNRYLKMMFLVKLNFFNVL